MAKKKPVKAEPKKIGRPTVELQDEKLRAFMRLKPSLEDCAAFFQCSTSHIEKTVKLTYGISFSVFRDENMVHTRFNLVRNALQQAQKGNTAMLIFCLKNLCGWKDRHDTDELPGNGITIRMAYDPTKKGTSSNEQG